jgi:hypothetical protein
MSDDPQFPQDLIISDDTYPLPDEDGSHSPNRSNTPTLERASLLQSTVSIDQTDPTSHTLDEDYARRSARVHQQQPGPVNAPRASHPAVNRYAAGQNQSGMQAATGPVQNAAARP